MFNQAIASECKHKNQYKMMNLEWKEYLSIFSESHLVSTSVIIKSSCISTSCLWMFWHCCDLCTYLFLLFHVLNFVWLIFGFIRLESPSLKLFGIILVISAGVLLTGMCYELSQILAVLCQFLFFSVTVHVRGQQRWVALFPCKAEGCYCWYFWIVVNIHAQLDQNNATFKELQLFQLLPVA